MFLAELRVKNDPVIYTCTPYPHVPRSGCNPALYVLRSTVTHWLPPLYLVLVISRPKSLRLDPGKEYLKEEEAFFLNMRFGMPLQPTMKSGSY